jgi:N-acyl-D-amino-acid deacylase
MVAALLPPWIFCAGSAATILTRLQQPEVRAAAQIHWAEQRSYVLRSGGPEGVVLTYAPSSPDLVGLDFAQIAKVRGTTMADAACDILLAEGENLYNTLVRHVFATPEDLDRLLAEPNCAVASDGVASAPYAALADLRTTRDSYGYTACFLQEYVRERRVFSLEEAVRRMTYLPAQLCDLGDRGRLIENGGADVVIFDPVRVKDLTTDLDPNQYPAGVECVLVNGSVVLESGQCTGCLPGQVLQT